MAVEDEQQSPLHILLFPLLAPSHLIPIADMAALFASRGVRCTILTTPVNAAIIRSAVDRANDLEAGCIDSSEWMPQGFTELVARGFIIRGWAPQMVILNHPAIGGFDTHCGWNSMLEAVSAGVPMVTWPWYSDQFYNEKLVVDVLKVGVSIGAKDYASPVEAHEVIAGGVIAESIGRLMGSNEEGDVIKKKAKYLGVEARSAVENAGSSYNDVGRRLIDELMARRSCVKVGEDVPITDGF